MAPGGFDPPGRKPSPLGRKCRSGMRRGEYPEPAGRIPVAPHLLVKNQYQPGLVPPLEISGRGDPRRSEDTAGGVTGTAAPPNPPERPMPAFCPVQPPCQAELFRPAGAMSGPRRVEDAPPGQARPVPAVAAAG